MYSIDRFLKFFQTKKLHGKTEDKLRKKTEKFVEQRFSTKRFRFLLRRIDGKDLKHSPKTCNNNNT